MKKLMAIDILKNLKNVNWKEQNGKIKFYLADIEVIMKKSDMIGITLQSWLKEYFIINNIYFREPKNSQEFPDFFLSENEGINLLEVKAFNYSKTPAFDIANFESYCDSLKNKPYRLYADYIIFGYKMDQFENISIEDIWLHKIWEISGKSKRFPLKTQIKRDIIYNIRPNSNFKLYKNYDFNNPFEFIKAIYETLSMYKSRKYADEWLNIFKENYYLYYNKKLIL